MRDTDNLQVRNDRTQALRHEQRNIAFLPGGWVTFRTWKGKYWSAQPNGQLQANRGAANAWEKFKMFVFGDKILSVRSWHGKWLSAQPDGRMEINRGRRDAWEKFLPLKAGNPITFS